MIGIFDSGVGGLTVVKQVIQALPQYKIIYFGDTARIPYGSRSEAIIKKYSLQDTEFLLEKNAEIIVIACHTASAVAADYLREKFPQTKIFDVVQPGLDQALKVTRSKRIGIIGTEATVKSEVHERYLKKIDPQTKVFYQACPLLVPLVEEGWLKRQETRRIVRYYLKSLKKNKIDTLVLACTHYPLLAKIITEIAGKSVKVVDPAQEVAIQIKEYLQKNPTVVAKLTKNGQQHEFYASDVSDQFLNISHKILGKNISVKSAEVT
ncbi:MAG: glutamate racemase [Parcubacteria group bacterium]|nr:glutamate racemase [Parcubacteria group bacterium]